MRKDLQRTIWFCHQALYILIEKKNQSQIFNSECKKIGFNNKMGEKIRKKYLIKRLVSDSIVFKLYLRIHSMTLVLYRKFDAYFEFDFGILWFNSEILAG